MDNTITFSALRSNLAKTMDKIIDNHEVVIVTRTTSKPVVIMSLEDFNSYEETAYLLKSPANAKRLSQSIKQYEQGKCVKRDLIK
jgi:antitoxin YefM